MIRGLMWLGIIVVVIVLGSTVPLGKRTFFGHIRAIWATEEAQDMRHGIEDKAKPAIEKARDNAGPALDRVKRGIEAGIDEARKTKSGSNGSAPPVAAPMAVDARP